MECLLCNENSNSNSIWIKKYEYWNVHACWFQHTLGTLGIILKRHSESFSNLTENEIKELGEIIKSCQKALNKEFQPDWYNIQQNCNWHHHLHFLVLPRYKNKKEFSNKTFEDKTFENPIIYTKEKVDEDIRIKLSELLKKHL